MTGVRHAWTFDDMFSTFATQGIEAKKKGEFTREELAPLAEVNVTSLKEYDFFTYAKANGKKVEFDEPPAGYYLDFDKKDTVLTLYFTLPLKAPVKAKDLTLEVYDREFFVDFSFAEKDPVKLVGAPAQLQALGRAAAGNGRRAVAATEPTRCRPARSVADHRRRIRQQDFGEMSVNSRRRAATGRSYRAAGRRHRRPSAGGRRCSTRAFAQAGPFGAPRPQAPAAAAWAACSAGSSPSRRNSIAQFSSLIRAAKADGSAAWSLFGLSFLYGIFHAAGPGHGKAVISSYMVANEETWTRGVVLSFASALLQALVAVAIVGIAAALLNATAATMGRAVNVIEIVSYSLIILIGVRLLWVKGRAFIAALRTLHRPAAVGAAVTPAHHHDHAQHHRPSRSRSSRPRS